MAGLLSFLLLGGHRVRYDPIRDGLRRVLARHGENDDRAAVFEVFDARAGWRLVLKNGHRPGITPDFWPDNKKRSSSFPASPGGGISAIFFRQERNSNRGIPFDEWGTFGEHSRNSLKIMAGREGFEPSVTFLPHTLSKRAHSTTLTPALGGREARKRIGAWQSIFLMFGGIAIHESGKFGRVSGENHPCRTPVHPWILRDVLRALRVFAFRSCHLPGILRCRPSRSGPVEICHFPIPQIGIAPVGGLVHEHAR